VPGLSLLSVPFVLIVLAGTGELMSSSIATLSLSGTLQS
jgi:hypothetical protein